MGALPLAVADPEGEVRGSCRIRPVEYGLRAAFGGGGTGNIPAITTGVGASNRRSNASFDRWLEGFYRLESVVRR